LPSLAILQEENLDADPQHMQDEPQQCLHPDSFYCPLTRQVMEDPVVGPDGNSFERSAVLERDAASDATQDQLTYYPNRALQIIIDKEKQHALERGIVMGALHRVEERLRAGLEQVMERAILPTPNDYHRPLPDAYYCPITLDIMSRPVIDPDGNTYERRAILGWIRVHGTSPLTRSALTSDQLRGNNALEELIDAEVNKADDSIHPSIRRWKESRKEEEDEENMLADLPSREEMSLPENEENRRPISQEEIDKFWRAQLIFAISFIFMIAAIRCALALIPLQTLFYIVFSVLIVFLNMVLVEEIHRRAQGG